MDVQIGQNRYTVVSAEDNGIRRISEDELLRLAKNEPFVTFYYEGGEAFDIGGTTGELHGDFDLLKRILAERAGQLCVRLSTTGGEVCLTFPSYLYDFVEDTRARAIHHKIEGSGYVYRECIWRRTIRLREYDSLFTRAMDEGGHAAVDVALGRLLAPCDLAPGHKERYERYLEATSIQVLIYLLGVEPTNPKKIGLSKDNDSTRPTTGTLSFATAGFPWDPMAALYLMTERCLISRECLQEILPYCDDHRHAEAAALLLAYDKKHWGKQRGQRMVPDDF